MPWSTRLFDPASVHRGTLHQQIVQESFGHRGSQEPFGHRGSQESFGTDETGVLYWEEPQPSGAFSVVLLLQASRHVRSSFCEMN